MTQAKDATSRGLQPHWKIRISLGGALLHIASWTEPVWHPARGPYEARSLQWDAIDDPDYGDTLGFIDWSQVAAVTWRYAR